MADARTGKQKVKEITDRLEEWLKGLSEGEKYKNYTEIEMLELKSSLDTIRRTSSELIKRIEAQLLEIEKERAAEQAQEDMILLVANTDRSEYDLLSVKGVERTELFNSLLAMKDDAEFAEVALEAAE